ncbi:MAG TPA: hypothetical protein VGS10_01520 [Terracidiphilus sp.]|nr:hypothetical protein [Terracidiphilus sp.]
MAKGNAETREQEILRIAALLGEGYDDLDREGLRRELESSGTDPARTTVRFHEAAERLAEGVRRTGKTVP